MILILNTIVNPVAIRDFNSDMADICGRFDIPYETKHTEEEFPVEFLDSFSHLIISGSELRASVDGPWDEKLEIVLNHFINTDKPVLGICWGHQMLGKLLSKNNVCKLGDPPEVGWRRIDITSHPIFKGMTDPVFYESHYDEVTGLSSDFKVIATSKDCAVQAFQYREKPVWGVQFHPEVSLARSKKMKQRTLTNNPDLRKYYFSENVDQERVEENFLIFRNFHSL